MRRRACRWLFCFCFLFWFCFLFCFVFLFLFCFQIRKSPLVQQYAKSVYIAHNIAHLDVLQGKVFRRSAAKRTKLGNHLGRQDKHGQHSSHGSIKANAQVIAVKSDRLSVNWGYKAQSSEANPQSLQSRILQSEINKSRTTNLPNCFASDSARLRVSTLEFSVPM